MSSIGGTGFGCTNLSCSTSVEKFGLKLEKASSTPNASSFGFWATDDVDGTDDDEGEGVDGAGVSQETLKEGAKSVDINKTICINNRLDIHRIALSKIE